MKKLIIIWCLVCLISVATFAQKDPFMPPNAITMGQGGAFTAVASGYNAFYYNPAGFARKSEFTLLSMDVYGIMDRTLYGLMADQLKQYTGTGYRGFGPSGSARGFDVSSIISQTDVNNLTQAGTDIGNYLTSVSSASVSSAFTTVSNNPAYASILAKSGVSPTSPPTSLAQLAPAILSLVSSDPALVSSFLSTFLNQVAVNSGTPVTGAAAAGAVTVGSTLGTVNNNLYAAFPSGNADIGATVGIGYVGGGFGLGLFSQVDAQVYTPEGKTISAATGRITDTLSLVGGLGFNVWDGFSLGISLRPTILGYTPVSAAAIMGIVAPGFSGSQSSDMFATLFSNGIYKGFYVGIDIGALLDVGPFTFGLVVKDLIPYQLTYSYYTDPLVYLQDLGNLKGAQAVSNSYQVPWGKINIGVSWHPDLGNTSKIFDPRISIDMHDVLGFLRYSDADISNSLHTWNWLDLINVGAEINLLGFIALRGGFNQGAWTAGLGIRLLVIDINTAFSAKYKDGFKSLNDYSEVGFSFEIALLRLK